MEKDLQKILTKLKSDISYKWKPQSQTKDKSKWQCVAYIDSRDVQNLLDETCIWQNEFYESKGKLFCKIGILTEDGWIWRSDSGFLENEYIEDGTESKGEVSDTFKRTAVQWGIGRFLYSKKIQWITNEEYQANKYNLTDYINNRQGKQQVQQKLLNKTKNWLNYDSFIQIIEAGNRTEQDIAKVIQEDGYTLSQYAKNAVRHYVETGEIDKDLFFKQAK